MSTMMEENDFGSEPETFSHKERWETFDGKVVQLTGSTLLMANNDGQQSFHTVAADAKFTCDGQDCQAQELRPGNRIRVITNKNLNVATSIESLDQNTEFKQTC